MLGLVAASCLYVMRSSNRRCLRWSSYLESFGEKEQQPFGLEVLADLSGLIGAVVANQLREPGPQ
jgi:hypothetical protein